MFIETITGKQTYIKKWTNWKKKYVKDKEMRGYKFQVKNIIENSEIKIGKKEQWILVRWEDSIVNRKNKMQMKMKHYFRNEIKKCPRRGENYFIRWENTWIKRKDLQ